jgi:hypothetical protein
MQGFAGLKAIVIGVITAIFVLFGVPSIIENLDASEVMVIQSVTGDLEVYTEPGPQWQWFGTVTTYPRQRQYVFGNEDGKDTSIKLQFNDGGLATLHGSVNWEMPLDKESILKIHKNFGSAEAVEKRAVVKMMDAATYLAGPLMSSIESAGERRSELVNVINDQAERGVYVTRVNTIVKKDDLTKEEKTVNVTEIQRNADGSPRRQQGSVLQEFNIRLQPISIKNLDYDEVVKKQIVDRQKSTTAVQLAIAQALKAEQDAITAEKNGMATAAEAKWKQETIKAQVLTEGEQKRDAAKLAKEEAEFYKQQQILIGQGDAERKRAVMEADGALDPKLHAWIEVNKAYAAAIGEYQGNWVPTITMDGKSTASGAQAMIDLLSAKTAKDLSLDMSLTGNTKKK